MASIPDERGDAWDSMAGYEQQQYTVVGEFMGDLPFHYASQSAAAGVGNADACLIYIRAPPLDAQLSRLPRSFLIGDEKVHISLPGQRGTSSIATALHQQQQQQRSAKR